MGHSLDRRYERAAELGLMLKRRTASGLSAITGSREYLRSRYAAREASVIQLNKLEAMLNHVADKVGDVFELA